MSTLEDMSTAMLERPMTGGDLVKDHQAEVWRYLRFLGCDPAQADDLAQEVFVSVLAKPPDQRSRGETRVYLRTVARNQYLMTLRRRDRRPKEVELAVAEKVWAETQHDNGDAWLDALDDCLSHLEGRAKEVIELHYRQSKSRAFIAEQLEMTADGVKSLLRRTRDVLRQCVEGKVEGSGQ